MDVKRDTKRVIQVLLPNLPGPAVDLAMSTIFASASAQKSVAAAGNNHGSQPSQRWKLRKMNSGNFGELSITPPAFRKAEHRRFLDAKLTFDLVTNEAALPERAKHSRR